jgi:N-methylhydantoinase B/oxoprolinase/acetone carboxylase alpha subunit
MIPIFWEGQMLGWAGGVAHQVDIGASTPGHDPVATANRFEDGFYVTAEKIGENHEVRKDFKIRAQRSVRTPLYWDLDEKCRIAGIYMYGMRFIALSGKKVWSTSKLLCEKRWKKGVKYLWPASVND